MSACRCTPGSHFREIAVRTFPKGVETVTVSMLMCDECEPGKAKIAARSQPPKDAGNTWKPPRPLATVTSYVSQLRDEQRNVPDLWWRVDPDMEHRMTRDRWAKIVGATEMGRAAK